jgi:hypothetical protein
MPTRQVVTEDGPSPAVELMTIAGRGSHVQCRAWATRSSPIMRAKRAATLKQTDWQHLGLQ